MAEESNWWLKSKPEVMSERESSLVKHLEHHFWGRLGCPRKEREIFVPFIDFRKAYNSRKKEIMKMFR